MSELIAFIGVGNMGNPMAQNLVKAGKKVKVFDVSKKMIDKAKKKGLRITNYDRNKEPRSSKKKENSSIAWGVSSCLKLDPPDIIYHKGDMGKEPMIIIFGNDPSDVIKKILLIQ